MVDEDFAVPARGGEVEFHERVLWAGKGGAGDVFGVILSLGEDGIGYMVVDDGFAGHAC